MARSLYLVSYDISDDRARTRMAHLLESYGQRVQYSVFELWLTERELDRLQAQLEKAVEAEGAVRLYYLCAACRERVQVWGQGERTEELGLLMV